MEAGRDERKDEGKDSVETNGWMKGRIQLETDGRMKGRIQVETSGSSEGNRPELASSVTGLEKRSTTKLKVFRPCISN